MNIEDLISQYIDGSLSAEAEAELHHRLAVSPEARQLFRAHIMLRGLARDQRVLHVPSSEMRSSLFGRLVREEGMQPVGTVSSGGSVVAAASTAPAGSGGARPIPSDAHRRPARRRFAPWLIPLVIAGALIGVLWVTDSPDVRQASAVLAQRYERADQPEIGGDRHAAPGAVDTIAEDGSVRTSAARNSVREPAAGDAANAATDQLADAGTQSSGIESTEAPIASVTLADGAQTDQGVEEREPYKYQDQRSSSLKTAPSASRARNAARRTEERPRALLNRAGPTLAAVDGRVEHADESVLEPVQNAEREPVMSAPARDLDANKDIARADDATQTERIAETKQAEGEGRKSLKADAYGFNDKQSESQRSNSDTAGALIAASRQQNSDQLMNLRGASSDHQAPPTIASNERGDRPSGSGELLGDDTVRSEMNVLASNAPPPPDQWLGDQPARRELPLNAAKKLRDDLLSVNAAEQTNGGGSGGIRPDVKMESLVAAQAAERSGAEDMTTMYAKQKSVESAPNHGAPSDGTIADRRADAEMSAVQTSAEASEESLTSRPAISTRGPLTVAYILGVQQNSLVDVSVGEFGAQIVVRGGVELEEGAHQIYVQFGTASYREEVSDSLMGTMIGGVVTLPGAVTVSRSVAVRFNELWGGVGYRFNIVGDTRWNIGVGASVGAGRRYLRVASEIPIGYRIARSIRIELVPMFQYARAFDGNDSITVTDFDATKSTSEQRQRRTSLKNRTEITPGVGIGASVSW